VATIFIATAACLNLLIVTLMDEKVDLWSNPTLLKVIRIWILSICILIVAIPEGMPLAISLAMALSI
jgi:magnesium-transporting ATPase (P-type)